MDVEETRDSLLDMVSRDPDVVSCLHRVFNTVLLNDIDVDEGGVAVKPELLATLNREYKRFFKDAVVLSYTCGFVPYYVARAQTEGGVRGIKVPRCLPLGSFTWSVRMNTDAREALASYEVRVASGAVPQKAVFVFETETPVVRAGAELSSPLLGVHRQYVMWQEAMAQLAVTGEWNRVKHLAVTERIEVKDQTTSGIQLLDEQRRYNLTGEHNSVLHNNLMRLKGVGVTASVADAFHHAVQTQFSDAPDGAPRVGSKRAAVHLLPPNTDVVELGAMDTGNAMHEAKVEFQEAVYTFFALPNINKSREEAARRGASALHREQYSNIMYMQAVLERLGEAAYAQCFGARRVRFALRALPRFEITSVDDIKVLCEIDMLTEEDKTHLRRRIMNRR